ncbi:MAG: gamma-glutamyltransferase [Terriglobia bacterium]
MSLLASIGASKIRSGRFAVVQGTLATACILVTCLWSLVAAPIANAASARPVAAEKGMVVTAQHLATKVGVDILKRGGSAIDAAVAVGYALAVVYPAAGNLGGGGFMTITFADGRKTFLDFREKAPRAASRDMFLDKDGNVIKGLSATGWLAVGVPGTVSGLEYARKKYGTMTRAALTRPAIKLAEDGFALEQGDADMLASAAEDLRRFPATAKIFLDKGQSFVAGQRLVQPDLAETLRLIRKQGVDGFYRGKTAAAIVKTSRAGGGIIEQDDLESYKTHELAPLECDYRGYHVISAPPPSSGGVAICEMLNVLEGYPLRELGWGSAQALHYEIEAMRHAFVDRNNLLGDPDFVSNPVRELIDKRYAAKIRDVIKPNKAEISIDIGQGVVPHEGRNTTHFSIIDADGNMVAGTQTVNTSFGSCLVIPGTGFVLNNEMDDFALVPGKPNAYGLIGYEANAPAKGRRPLSSMTPTFVFGPDKDLVIGTPGGSRIITMVLEGVLAFVDGMDAQQIVAKPRFHHQYLPDVISAEPGALDAKTIAALRRMNYTVNAGEHRWGFMNAVIWDRKTNALDAASDPRGDSGEGKVQ